MFLFDLTNALGIMLFLIISIRLNIIPIWLGFLLSLFAFTPFLVNDFLFPWQYMPDQLRYYSVAHAIREFSFDYDESSRTILYSSWVLSFLPLPFIQTIQSLGFYNRLIVTFMVVWLYHYKSLRGVPLIIFIFYPSLLIYSSLALRDVLILFFMLFSVIFLLERRFYLFLFFLAPLFYLKFQNFFIVLIFSFYVIFFDRQSSLFRMRFLMVFVAVFLFIYITPIVIPKIEFYRFAMFIEDGGDPLSYIPIASISDFFYKSLFSGFEFMMKPFLWEANGVMQVIQSVENLFVFILIVVLMVRLFSVRLSIGFKWLLFLGLAFCINGIVVSNYGTSARYRFTFIVVFCVCSYYDIFLSSSKGCTIKKGFHRLVQRRPLNNQSDEVV